MAWEVHLCLPDARQYGVHRRQADPGARHRLAAGDGLLDGPGRARLIVDAAEVISPAVKRFAEFVGRAPGPQQLHGALKVILLVALHLVPTSRQIAESQFELAPQRPIDHAESIQLRTGLLSGVARVFQPRTVLQRLAQHQLAFSHGSTGIAVSFTGQLQALLCQRDLLGMPAEITLQRQQRVDQAQLDFRRFGQLGSNALCCSVQELAGRCLAGPHRVRRVGRVRPEDVFHESLHGLRGTSLALCLGRTLLCQSVLPQGRGQAAHQREQHCSRARSRDVVASKQLAEAVQRSVGACMHRHALQVAVQVVGKVLRGRIAVRWRLFQCLHHDRIQVAPQRATPFGPRQTLLAGGGGMQDPAARRCRLDQQDGVLERGARIAAGAVRA
mmetsp:Transcript_23908/g.56764  ORF Transcript_23908/g.56764 Transcript_23908/m.56764 type:complete len:386 (+) Transcript_23908:451-1608(+)